MTFRILRAALLLAACLISSPSWAFNGRGDAITYVDEQNERHIHYFNVQDGHLYSNHYDGTQWTWTDHGQPSRDAGELWSPEAITYLDNSGKQRIYVFVPTGQGRLKLRYFNGYQWQWVDQGSTRVSPNSTSAITYVDPDGNRRIYLFGANPDNNHLVTNYWNGSSWLWADNGSPPGASSAGLNAEAITYVDGQGARRIDVFCGCGISDVGRQLLINGWSGSSWSWFNHGGTQISEPHALTFTESSGDRRIHVFVGGAGNNPQVHSRIEGNWYWINLGKPVANALTINGLDAIAYVDFMGNHRMQVFYLFEDVIWSRSWNGSSWANWMNHGLPAGSSSVSNPVALTYYDSRTNSQRTHLFVRCWTGICDHVFNGSTWQWQDLGKPKE